MSQEPMSQEPNVTYDSDGKPFKTEKEARAFVMRKGMDANRVLIKPQGNGFVIELLPESRSITTPEKSIAITQNAKRPKVIYAQDGDHFHSENMTKDAERKAIETAKKELKRVMDSNRAEAESRGTKYPFSESDYEIKKQPKVNPMDIGEPPRFLIIAKERYFVVRYQVKASPLDTNDVLLGVGTEQLQIQRNKPVIIRERFLEAGEHGVYQHFVIEPGQDRKVDYSVMFYPSTVIREATKEEYDEFKKTGVVKT